jgi:hypothetical protein
MEHNLLIDSNRQTLPLLTTQSSELLAAQLDLSKYVSAADLAELESKAIHLALLPLNFDNQIERDLAREFLTKLDVETPDWRVFLPVSEIDDDRVFVTEFLTVNNELVGLVAIEMTSPLDAPNTRVAVMSCLLNLELLETDLDLIQEFISNHLEHLSKRQNWKDLKLGEISSFTTLSKFQQC